jgi:hypothetical protein
LLVLAFGAWLVHLAGFQQRYSELRGRRQAPPGRTTRAPPNKARHDSERAASARA